MYNLCCRVIVTVLFLACWPATSSADDVAEQFIREAQNRAEYWKVRGHEFDPFLMSADSMDRQVQNQERAVYWADRGFKFDPKLMSVWAMNRKAEAILRVEYWKRWGIQFDAELMDAETMDDAAVKLKRLQSKLAELKEKTGVQPAIAVELAVKEILQTPPRVKGGKQRRPAGIQTPGTPAPMSLAPGLGGNAGGANRGGANRGGGPQGTRGTSGETGISSGSTRPRQSGGGRLQIPPGIDPEEFFEFLKRLEIGF